MNEKIEGFTQELRTKLDAVDKRMKGLKASAKGTAEKAKSDVRAQLAVLESSMRLQRSKVQSAETKAKAWLDEKKTATSEKIASWKAQHDVKKLVSHADNAEHYAAATMQLAVAAIDEAERATVEAVVARMDADAAQMAPAKGA